MTAYIKQVPSQIEITLDIIRNLKDQEKANKPKKVAQSFLTI